MRTSRDYGACADTNEMAERIRASAAHLKLLMAADAVIDWAHEEHVIAPSLTRLAAAVEEVKDGVREAAGAILHEVETGSNPADWLYGRVPSNTPSAGPRVEWTATCSVCRNCWTIGLLDTRGLGQVWTPYCPQCGTGYEALVLDPATGRILPVVQVEADLADQVKAVEVPKLWLGPGPQAEEQPEAEAESSGGAATSAETDPLDPT